MRRRFSSGFVNRAAVVSLMLLLVLGISPALAAPDRKAPTRPTNLRVTAVTSYSVSLAWNPSTDNSGVFSYIICCAYNNMATVPQTATSYTFTQGLEAGRTFSFRIFARDAAGNSSGYSNSVTVTLPADTQPPPKPIVTVTAVGPTHVSLLLSSVDDGPHVWYTILQNGAPTSFGGSNSTPTITGLQPSTAYTFTVQARDFAGHQSPFSDPVTVTTLAAPNDSIPPSQPGNLSGMDFGEEVWLSWTQSTDNLTPQSLIKYEVYVNDVLDHTLVGRGDTVLYGTAGMLNVFKVIAVDSAGNKSTPATFSVNIP
jgi:chitinase